MYDRNINNLAPARQMVGCAIAFFVGGQRHPQPQDVCSPKKVSTSVVINFETNKLPGE